MILIADSGSTKLHWCLMAANGHTEDFYTDGINPMFQTAIAMQNAVTNQLLPQIGPRLWAGELTDIFFYGAGCTPEKIPFVEQALQAIFRRSTIHVGSDMLGAARGLLGRERGVACILGTGSGSCLYDGENIEWCVPSLGYVLGDEGSGAVIGRHLVGDVLKNQLPPAVAELFFSEMQTSKADIFEAVYRKPFPNRYLASLQRFAGDHLDIPEVRALVRRCMDEFVLRNVIQYPNAPVGFVGSIAFAYRDILAEAMHAAGREISTIVRDPIPGLCEYHRSACVPTT